MKKLKLILFLLVINIAASASNQFLFRIHVGSYKREEVPKNIRETPNMKKYVLPEGYNCFFSGGYYLYFEGAYRQLKKVHAIGFENATIRVFKNEKLIPVFDGLDLIEEEIVNPTPIPANEKVDKQIYSLSSKWTLRNRADLYREIIMPHLTDTTRKSAKEGGDGIDLDWKLKLKKFGKFWGNKKPKSKSEDSPENNSRPKREENIREEKDEVETKKVNKSNNQSESSEKEPEEITELEEDTTTYDEALLAAVEEGMVEEKAEEVIEENDEKLELNEKYIPDERPEFRIYLTSAEKGGTVPMSIKYVPDIVYTFEKKTLTLYTVGYFESSAEAQAELANYRNEGFYNAKIIGVYKSIVVSQKIADDILERYLKGK